MGINITVFGKPTTSADQFQLGVTLQSDTPALIPVSVLTANLAEIYGKAGIQTNEWTVALVYLVRSTNPAPNQYVYSYTVAFSKKDTNASSFFRGPAGATGGRGLKGEKGDVGPQGATGVKGLRGPAGPAYFGASGAFVAVTGPVGPQGIQGVTGALGPTGPRGTTGPAGAGVIFSGDLQGDSNAQTVARIQSRPVGTGAPSANHVIMWDGARYEPQGLTLDPEVIGPAFTVSLAASLPLVELGSTQNSPSFTASYGPYSPTAALLTNDANGESRNVVGSPTSFISAQNYSKSTYGQSVVFTLNVSKGALARNANTSMTWTQKVYVGSGDPGANSSAILASLTGTLLLSKNGTFNTSAGMGQKIYFAYRVPYGTSTFTIGGFEGGFLSPTTISVLNDHGITENYYLYESENENLGSISLIVSLSPMPTLIPSELQVRGNPTKAVVDAKRVRGGDFVVADATERDSISPDMRREGMLIRTADDGKSWILQGDLTTWTEQASGGSSVPVYWEIPLVSGNQFTDTNDVTKRISERVVDLEPFPNFVNGKIRRLYLVVNADLNPGVGSMNVNLYNITDGIDVDLQEPPPGIGSLPIDVTSSTGDEYLRTIQVAFSPGLGTFSSGNRYRLEITMSGAGGGGIGTVTSAYFVVRYEET